MRVIQRSKNYCGIISDGII